MKKMRVLDAAYDYILKSDPETSITKHALRQLLISEEIPTVMCGRKRLVDLDKIDEYFDNAGQ